MIFFSKLLNVPIIDSRQETIGRLHDVIIKLQDKDYPMVTGIIFRTGKNLHVVDYDDVEVLASNEVTLSKHHCSKVWHDNNKDICLKRDILDRQIFDVEGIRVVRVNDLQLVRSRNQSLLVSIDVGNKALLRRLGLLFFPLTRLIPANFIDWRNLTFLKDGAGGLHLDTSYKKLHELHPADIANLIENLSPYQSTQFVQSMDEKTAAGVLAEVEPRYKDTLLEKLDSKILAKILEEMPTDDATDVIQDLSLGKRNEVFKYLGLKTAKTIHTLQEYKQGTAGSVMTADYFKVREAMTVRETIEEIRRKSNEHKSIYHIFVVDSANHLKGVISVRTLLLASAGTLVKDLMSEVQETVHFDTPDEEVATLLTKYNLLSVAVVDKDKRLMGIVTVDDVMRLLVPQA